MKPGDIFIPYKQFRGSFIPNWLICRPTNDLSQGAKLCYARLMQFSGKDGRCYPAYDTIGREIGVGRRMAMKYIEELEGVGLIRLVKAAGDTNHYVFLWHAWADSDQCLDFRQPVFDSEPANDRSLVGVNNRSPLGVNNSSPLPPPSNIDEKNQFKRVKEGKALVISFLSLGSQLDCPEFWELWADWVQHRREKKVSLTPICLKHQIGMLEKLPLDTALRTIKQSLVSGYEGLFEPRSNGKRPDWVQKSDLERDIRQHPGNPEYHSQIKPADREAFKQLLQRRATLTTQPQ